MDTKVRDHRQRRIYPPRPIPWHMRTSSGTGSYAHMDIFPGCVRGFRCNATDFMLLVEILDMNREQYAHCALALGRFSRFSR